MQKLTHFILSITFICLMTGFPQIMMGATPSTIALDVVFNYADQPVSGTQSVHVQLFDANELKYQET